MGQYYYLDGAVPIGPLSLQDVYTLLDREVVGAATMICREGGADWLLLNQLPELSGKAFVVGVTRSVSSDIANPTRSSSTEGNSRSSSSESRRSKKGGLNVTAIIIAALFSVVAVYVTYAITHQSQETIQEMDHLPTR